MSGVHFNPCNACEMEAHCRNAQACHFLTHTHASPAVLFQGGAAPAPQSVDDMPLETGEAHATEPVAASQASSDSGLIPDVLAQLTDEDGALAGMIAAAGNALTTACHSAAHAAGWWGTPDGRIADPRGNPLCFSNKLMLTVSELAEAMEGDRKGLKDDHLPQYDMRATELADTVIRCFDLAGAYGIELGEIIAAKLEYNARRADHKPAARLATGGKSY